MKTHAEIDVIRRAVEQELQACPFCGHKAVVERLGTSRMSCIVKCTNCSCTLETNEIATECGREWNSRHATTAIKWIFADIRTQLLFQIDCATDEQKRSKPISGCHDYYQGKKTALRLILAKLDEIEKCGATPRGGQKYVLTLSQKEFDTLSKNGHLDHVLCHITGNIYLTIQREGE